jgi:hypothetical protein
MYRVRTIRHTPATSFIPMVRGNIPMSEGNIPLFFQVTIVLGTVVSTGFRYVAQCVLWASPKTGIRSTGTKKMYVECTVYVPYGTLPPRPPPANRKPQTREPWPYQADFGTTISNSFLGQISYLRWGNPLRASAPVTH